MKAHLRRCVEATALICIVLVPVAMQPVAAAPFEPIKVTLFEIATMVMLGCVLLAGLAAFVGGQPHAQHSSQSRSAGLHASNPLFLPLITYSAVCLVATGLSLDPHLSFLGTRDDPVASLVMMMGCLFSVLLTQTMRDAQQIMRVRKALVIGSVPVVVYGLAQYLGLDPMRWISDEASPVHSTLGRSNFLGAYLAMVIPLTAIPLLVADGDRRQRSLWALVGLQVGCLVLTIARGAWLALVAGLATSLALLAYRRRNRKLLASAVLLLAFGLLVAALLTWVPFPFRPGSAPVQAEGLSFAEARVISVDQRLILWQRVLTLIPSRWVLGYGPRTLVQANAMQPWPEVADYVTLTLARDAHNLFLSQLVETGVLGLAALVVLLAVFFTVVWCAQARLADHRLQAIAWAVLTSMVVFIVQAQFNPSVIVHFVLFWAILALASALHRLSLDPACRPSPVDRCEATTTAEHGN